MNIKPYTSIAPVYDSLLRHVDYQEWYEYILSLMKLYAPGARTLLELGCGTGRFGSKFSSAGYSICGIDRSFDMLLIAKTRAFLNFRIFCADITAFHTAKKIDFIFSVHDTMNYLVEREEVTEPPSLCQGMHAWGKHLHVRHHHRAQHP